MPSHLSSVGFPAADDAALFDLAQRLGPAADPFDVSAGTYFRARDRHSGAELWLHTSADGERFFGAAPHLGGGPTLPVTLADRVVPADASPLEGAGRGVASGVPLLFDVPDFGTLDGRTLPATVRVELCGFAHEAEGFPSVDAYRAATDGKLKPAERSVIPVGLLDAGPPRPLAFVAGVVVSSEWRTNRLTGEKFGAVTLDTPMGGLLVALDPAVLSELPPAGGVLAGAVWLSGRVVGPGS